MWTSQSSLKSLTHHKNFKSTSLANGQGQYYQAEIRKLYMFGVQNHKYRWDHAKNYTNGTQLKTQPALTRTQHGLSFWRCWKARERPRSRARRVQGLWAPAKESGDKVVDRKRFSALWAEEWRGFRTERSSWMECGALLTMRSGSESYWWVGVQNDYRASNNLQWWGNKSRSGQGRGLSSKCSKETEEQKPSGHVTS